MSVTLTLARDIRKAAPVRATGAQFRRGQRVTLDGPVDWPGKPQQPGSAGAGIGDGCYSSWAFWDSPDLDAALIFGAEDVAGLEAPDTPAWRALFARVPPPFPATYRPPGLHDREPDRSWCLPEPPGEFAVGDVIRVARPDGYAYPHPPAWEGEVIRRGYYRPLHAEASGEHTYKLRLTTGSSVVISPSYLANYGARLELVCAADPRDEEDQPQ